MGMEGRQIAAAVLFPLVVVLAGCAGTSSHIAAPTITVPPTTIAPTTVPPTTIARTTVPPTTVPSPSTVPPVPTTAIDVPTHAQCVSVCEGTGSGPGNPVFILPNVVGLTYDKAAAALAPLPITTTCLDLPGSGMYDPVVVVQDPAPGTLFTWSYGVSVTLTCVSSHTPYPG